LKRGKQLNLGKESQIRPAGKMPKANFRSHGWSCLFSTSCNSRRSLIRRTSSAYTQGYLPSEQQSPAIVTSGKLIFLEMRNKSWWRAAWWLSDQRSAAIFRVSRSPSNV